MEGEKMPTTIQGETIYTLKEVAEGLGVHYQTIKGWVSDGKIRATKIGRSYRVTGAELQRLLEGRNGQATPHRGPLEPEAP
jgi:excisionase family DNA binding protein